ncbi:hypothetical protein [Actinomadura bangladeshensis]|uniref:hypothetical protein n=1 Tax=Actinomadura bangladeshensis TaxID=453573 RepID=UPI001404E0B4|nr:hypothetical protein [Actinomadura bangladeshensis]
MDRQGEDAPQNTRVLGLTPPPLLLELLAAQRWRHPGDDVMRKVIPWFADPLVFLTTLDYIRFNSQSLELFADDAGLSELFRVKRGGTAGAVDLPWLDADRAFFIAVNRVPGDDVAIALDYRSDTTNPRVVASDAWSTHQYTWRVIAPTLRSFADALGLLGDKPIPRFRPGEPDAPIP